MKYYIFLTVLFFGSFFVVQKLWAANTDIIINEIGAYPTSTHEWIEVWNKGDVGVDLSSWKFWENNTNHSLKAVTTTDSIVSPGEYVVICQDGDVFLRDYPNFIGSVFDSSWTSLSESGEEIGLKDEAGNFIEQFTYLSTSHFSLERKDPLVNDYAATNWQEHLSGNTVGAQNGNFIISFPATSSPSSSLVTTSTDFITSTIDNPTTTTPTTTETSVATSTSSTIFTLFNWLSVKLNEIVSDPIEGNEMIELYNNASTSAEIVDAKICDSTGISCKLFSGTIFAHDWLVVDLLTDRYLNNDGDDVILKDKNNNVIDVVGYGSGLSAPEKGQSLVRKLDGVDADNDSDWALTTRVTLGSGNQLVAPIVVNNSGGTSGNLNNSNIILNTSANKISTTTKIVADTVKISWKLDWPYGLGVNENGIFSAQGTADPRGGDINLLWNFGDNATGTGFIISHSFATSGIYLVSVSAVSTASTTGKKDFKIYVGTGFSSTQADIKIGNYLVNATSSDGEFVELKNFSTSSRNISGWKIKNKSGKEYELPENTNISPSGTLKFFRSVTHLSFDKDGDEIIFTLPNDKEIDKIILLNIKEIKKEVKEETKTPKTLKKEIKTSKTASVDNWRVVQGVVTVLPGVFGAQYFYISDGEKGFQVYQYKKDFPELKIGDRVTVRGEMLEISGVERIKISGKSSVSILGKDKNFGPLNLEDNTDVNVGALVKITGDVTSLKSNYLYIDDGNSETVIYFRAGAKINKQDLKLGDKLEVTGILEQTKSGLRVSPRDNNDIKMIGFSDQVLSQQTEADKAVQNDMEEKYLTATAGGVTTLLLGFLARSRGTIVVSGAKKLASVASKIIKRG